MRAFSRPTRAKTWPALVFGLALVFSSNSCHGPIGPGPSSGAEKVGAGFFAAGAYVYALGGLDATGAYRSEVWRAAVGADGSLGAWVPDAALPRGLAYASCLAVGDIAYVIGGRDAAGPRSEIYFTLINSDGHLGFSNSSWATNSRPLPEARSAAAPVMVAGRLFLVGGEGPSGTVASILDARVYNDGQVGDWYYSSYPLRAAGKGFAAALHLGKLWVAGGGSTAVYCAAPDPSGIPGPWTTGQLPGGPVIYPAMASTGDGLLIVGGSDAEGGSASKTRVYSSGAWTLSGATPSSCTGPGCAVVADTLIAPRGVGGSAPPQVSSVPISVKRADTPSVTPGDGFVSKGYKPRISAFPGDVVRYAMAATIDALPTELSGGTDTKWEAASPTPPKINSPNFYAFQAFRAGAAPSDIVYVNYRVFSTSMFVLSEGTLYPGSNSGYSSYSLAEKYSDGTLAPVSAVWYTVSISAPTQLALGWADENDSSDYTAPVQVSLFESDIDTPVRRVDGSEFFQLTGGFSSPVQANLQPGLYYLQIESTDASTGGSFGLSLLAGPYTAGN